MSTILKDWVAVNNNHGDLLKPETYTDVVTILSDVHEKHNSFKVKASLFTDHGVDYDDPHKDSASVTNLVLDKVYGTYNQMVTTPVSRITYDTTVGSGYLLLEVLRRVQLNRMLYNSVTNANGLVPRNIYPSVSIDYRHCDNPERNESLVVGTWLVTEQELYRLPFSTTLTDKRYIQHCDDVLPLEQWNAIFSTSSTSPFMIPGDLSMGFTTQIEGSLDRLSVDLTYIGYPPERSTIVTFSNGTRTIDIGVDQDRKLSILFDGSEQTDPDGVFTNDGRLVLELTPDGTLTYTVINEGIVSTHTTNVGPVVMPFTTYHQVVTIEDTTKHTYTEAGGRAAVYLVDESGNYITDSSGNRITKSTLDFGDTKLGSPSISGSDGVDFVLETGDVLQTSQFSIRSLLVFDRA
jgi:hypothetical protein